MVVEGRRVDARAWVGNGGGEAVAMTWLIVG